MAFQNNNDGSKSTYDVDDIKVLKGSAGIRKRPAMYIGDTGKKGLHHLIFEVLDNSVDEATVGYANDINITLNEDNSVEVSDNGRGIPIKIHPEYGVPAVQVILENIHAGGKFDHKSYKISGGLHGVGLSVVNALTEWLVVEINRDGVFYKQKFSKGKKASEPEITKTESNITGTKIIFYPDKEIFIFEPNKPIFHYSIVVSRVRELAFLTPQAKFTIHDKIEHKEEEFYYKGGIKEFIRFLNKDKIPLHDEIILISDSIKVDEESIVIVDVAMQYNQGYQENILTYANTINTIEGGTHETGFKTALTRAMNYYIENFMEKKYKEIILSGSDAREGLSAVISVKLPNPQFESQTKIKLGNPEIRQIVSKIVYEKLIEFLEQNPETAKKIVLKTVNAQKAREAAQKARNLFRKKSALDYARMPGKLADCSSNNPLECELFIVEGDSAGGSAKQGRERFYQAILPLRGKILNVEKARIDKIFQNTEIQAMIKAIGIGVQGLNKINGSKEDSEEDNTNAPNIANAPDAPNIANAPNAPNIANAPDAPNIANAPNAINTTNNDSDDDFNMKNLRYNRVILMADADVDGFHINTLLLTFFFRYMRPLIDEGHLFMAVPPLYEIKYKKTKEHAYSDSEKEAILVNLKDKYKMKNISNIKIKRFKGLGEMNPEELYETTMNRATRALKKITYEDYLENDLLFTKLMGKEVKARKKFIMQHYDKVKILDV